MLEPFKKIVLSALTGLSLLALLGFLSAGLILFREANAVHPALGVLVVVVVAAGIGLLVVYPLVRILRLPKALSRPEPDDAAAWSRYVLRFGNRLTGNRHLKADYPGYDALVRAVRSGDTALIESESVDAGRFLDARARDAVAKHAAAVFTATAVSQSGRLDGAIVMSAQIRMIREVAEIYIQRPGARDLWALYANVGAATFVAGEIQDSELLAVLGAPVTAGIAGFVPVGGTAPIISLLVNSFLDGSANAFLTLRVGTLARRYCALRVEGDRTTVSRSASLEAAGLLADVVTRGAARMARLTQNLVVSGAVKGTTGAAKGVAGLGGQLFGKILDMAGRAGTAAAESTGAGVRFLEESLRFWTTVADRGEAASVSPGSDGGLRTTTGAGLPRDPETPAGTATS